MTYLKQKNVYPLISVDIDNFSNLPGKFCMSYGFDNSQLVKSIDNIGLINNPYIFKRKDQSIEVVTGYRRLLALKELNIKEVNCYDLTESGISTYELLMVALHDNLFIRELNIIEKSMVISLLSELVKDINMIYKTCSLININRKDYAMFLKINRLDDPIKQSISDGVLHIKAIELLFNLDMDDILKIISWINNLRLSYNYQLQFIDYISDISRIKKCSISSLMNEEYFQCLLVDDKKNIPQKTKELMEHLRIRRNPNISRYQEIFEKKIRKLNLPTSAKIVNPHYFESEGYKLEIDFNNGEELKEIVKKLADEKYNLNSINDPWLDDGL